MRTTIIKAAAAAVLPSKRTHAVGKARKCLAVVCLMLAPLTFAQSPYPAPTSKYSQDSSPAVSMQRVSERGPVKAPVTIVEFSDFQCPFCRTMAPEVAELLQQYPDKIRVILKNSPLDIHPDSPLAHEAALAAGEQGKFWEMHDLLFANQKHFAPADLESYAVQLNLDLDKFKQTLASHKFKALVDHDVEEAENFGVNSTPTFFINGRRVNGARTYKQFASIVEQEISSLTGMQLASASKYLAAPERVPEIETGASPARGAKQPVVTIVEFSDMQCPFCAQSSPVLRELARQFPDKVRWVFKHHPLSFHKDALLAHKALLASQEQDKFWEMHDLIFSDQRAIQRDGLMKKAESLGLDMPRFVSDLNSNRFDATIDADLRLGTQLDISGTPTMFVNGRRVGGVLPLPAFRQLVEDEIAYAARTKQQSASLGKPVSKGPEDAPVTVEWFADLGSAYRGDAWRLMKQLMQDYPQKVRVVYRNSPLAQHQEGPMAHEAVLAANAQGKFWEMQELISSHEGAVTRGDLLTFAGRLSLDTQKFSRALEMHTYRATVDQDVADAHDKDVHGTPVFFVNGKRMDGIQSYSRLQGLVSSELDKTAVKKTL